MFGKQIKIRKQKQKQPSGKKRLCDTIVGKF